MGEIILFTAFCMRLQMNHCYITSMDDSPFSTLAQCEAAIKWVTEMQWNKYEHIPCGEDPNGTGMCPKSNGPRPMAHWCITKNW